MDLEVLRMCAVLAPLIKEHGIPDKLLPTATDSAFHGLAHIIIDQQLSVLAARSIANRVLAACGVCDSASAVLERDLHRYYSSALLPRGDNM